MPSFKKRRRWTDNHHVFENNTVDSSGLSMSVADQGFYVVVISHQAEHRCMWPTTCAISITGLGLILSLWLAQIIMPHQATLSCGPTCMGHGGQGLLSRFLEKNQVQREVPRAFSGWKRFSRRSSMDYGRHDSSPGGLGHPGRNKSTSTWAWWGNLSETTTTSTVSRRSNHKKQIQKNDNFEY